MMIRFGLFATVGLLLLAICHDASARQFRVLYSFCAQTNCADGEVPESGLIADGQGNFYGTTIWGGSRGGGVVFELVHGKQGNWHYQIIHDFCSEQYCNDGAKPEAGLIMDTGGNLFGTTSGNPSTIFKLSPDTNHTHWTLTTLFSFCRHIHECSEGRFVFPYSALTYAGKASGALYDGTSPLYGYGQATIPGGGHAFVYRYSPQAKGSSVERILEACSYSCPTGENPIADPLLGNDGSLYGTMSVGGRYGYGVVFALDVTTGVETVLHDFCAQPQCSDGAYPSGGLMRDAAGNLYGNASGGSPTSYCQDFGFGPCGVVYRLAPQSGQYDYSILNDLCGKPNCSDGDAPRSGLSQDSAGNLYGIAGLGGGMPDPTGAGAGTVFEANGTLRAIHHFCREANCSDGALPYGPLLMDAKGNLFGTTNEGGAYFDLPNVFGGTIFEITN